MAIRSTRPRTTSVVIRDIEEVLRRATLVPIVQSYDKEIAQRLFEEDQAHFKREQRIARERAIEQEAKDAALIKQMEDSRILVDMIAERKRFFAAQRAVEQRSKPPTKVISFILMDSKVVKDSGKKDDSSSKQARSRKKRAGSKLKPKSPKKLKVIKEQESAMDDAEKEELRDCLDIVPRDDIAINFESLTTKYPIVDWKTHILTKNMMYYQIIRADRSSKNYKIFSEMLDDFDKQDVVDLYSLVKESKEDEIWKVAIHMMVEKKFPLTQEMLSRMLNRRLEVDHESTMAFELIRFIKAQLEE
ncbi:hypothetical protein Tco_0286899 [Tanacetum coccineum]